MTGGLINSNLPAGMSSLPASQIGALADMIVEELRNQFGNAEVQDINGAKYAVVKLDTAFLRRAILSNVEPRVAKVTDVVVKDGVVELRIRLL